MERPGSTRTRSRCARSRPRRTLRASGSSARPRSASTAGTCSRAGERAGWANVPRLPVARRPRLPDARPGRPARRAAVGDERQDDDGGDLSIGDQAPGFELPDTEGARALAAAASATADRGRVHLQPLPLRARLARPDRRRRARLRRPRRARPRDQLQRRGALSRATPTRRCSSACARTAAGRCPTCTTRARRSRAPTARKTTPDVFVRRLRRPPALPRRPGRRLRRPVAERRMAARRARRGARRARPRPGRDRAGRLQRSSGSSAVQSSRVAGELDCDRRTVSASRDDPVLLDVVRGGVALAGAGAVLAADVVRASRPRASARARGCG